MDDKIKTISKDHMNKRRESVIQLSKNSYLARSESI